MWSVLVRILLFIVAAGKLILRLDTAEHYKLLAQQIESTLEFSSVQRFSEDQFEHIRLLGTGYFGEVSLARLSDSNGQVAIKKIHVPRLIARGFDPLQELRIMRRLHHRHICRLYGVISDDTRFMLVLEALTGGDLFEYCIDKHKHSHAAHPISEDKVRSYAVEILRALEYIHASGIVYSDLKLENIMRTADDHVKLIDFGVSADVDGRVACGTIEIAPPELRYAGILQDAKMLDFYAFGCFLYVMMEGALLTCDETETLYEFVHSGDALRDLIRSLTCHDVNRRLYCIQKIKLHQWFAGTSWDMTNSTESDPDTRSDPLEHS